ncbi:phosphoglycerate dehydrogenase [Bradyrhizobium sp. NAS96.2]|uniref:phosphoglycerate dehydrogenase n=1 Tax=Bradyrhizobium sp. NAS96.2 TaxID=1680160 RepID=UPI0009392606|nr:phosphoglycerate dehydrogenase [Bradyrhizobium sp. NAS96.2]OKO80878.1 hydroxyacid dehydrogenase [Bradyrhizobium sp. NAS96.2]
MNTLQAGKHKVVVTQRFFDAETIDYLAANGCEAVLADLPPGQGDGDLPLETMVRLLQGASGWIVGHAWVTRELLAALPDLQVVSRRGVGYERIDLDAVRDLGRVATIAAGANDATVADLTIGLMIAVARRFRECQAGLEAGSWAIPLGTDLYRKTVGVVGLGRIGRGVVRRLKGFEARVLAYDEVCDKVLAAEGAVEYVDLAAIFAHSDYLTIHAPLTPTTRFLAREETIRHMKPTSFLINAARGGLVEDRDLLAALKEKRLAGAGLDVFVSESDPSYLEVTRELISLPNVVATPHVGASTTDGLGRTNRVAAECVVAVLGGDTPPASCVVADGRQSAVAHENAS